MDTLKTAAVVVLLLAVVYGVYVILNKPDAPLPQEIAWHAQKASEPLQIDMGTGEAGGRTPTVPLAGFPAAPPGTGKPMIYAELSPEPAADGTPAMPAAAAPPADRPQSPPFKDLAAAPPAAPPLPALSSGPAALPTSGAPPLSLLGSATGAGTAAAPPVTGGNAPGAATETASAPTLLGRDNPSGAPENLLGGAASPVTLPGLPDLRRPVATEAPPAASLASGEPASNESSSSTPRPAAAGPAGDSAAIRGVSENPSNASAAPVSLTSAPDLGPTASLPGTQEPAGNSTLPPSLDPLSPSASTPAKAAEPGGNGAPVVTSALYDAAIREAHSLIEGGEWYQALFVLSKFYGNPELSSEQQRQLLDLLDPLAAKVIYSTEHLVEQPHEVSRGDTLAGIAQRYQVPPELLANINGLEKPDVLVPGTKLKVLRGPFRAEVDLGKRELTLFASQLYAGRFPVSLGEDPAPKPGEFRVQEKQPGRVYYAGDGRTIPSDDPTNPYGQVWMGLGSELCIHGSSERGDTTGMGCISLSPRDAYDVYHILSSGSSVVIR